MTPAHSRPFSETSTGLSWAAVCSHQRQHAPPGPHQALLPALLGRILNHRPHTMQPHAIPSQTIAAYIAGFPPDIQAILQRIRQTIHEAAPEAAEAIKYQMPTFTLHGNLVHFAAFKNHIGFYPTPSGIEQFQTELAPYASSKGAVRFPFTQPIPYDLIARIVRFRVAENLAKAATRRRQK